MPLFDDILTLVPWLSPREASDALNDIESQFFEAHPEHLCGEEIFDMTAEELKALEKKQDEFIMMEFKASVYIRRQ